MELHGDPLRSHRDTQRLVNYSNLSQNSLILQI
jgi:hypothetical protein